MDATYEIVVSGKRWTTFMDMHSGGRLKASHQWIVIEAPQALAELVFYNRFGHNPNRITCTCCGEDYSVSEHENSRDGIRYHWRWGSIYGKRARKHSDVRVAALQAMAEQNDSPQEAENARIAIRRQKRALQWTRQNVLFIKHEDIQPHEKVGSVPVEGWVWQ